MSQGTVNFHYGNAEVGLSPLATQPVFVMGGNLTVASEGETETTLTGSERAITGETINASGTIAAGKRHIQLIFSTDFTGTVAGVAFNGANDSYLDFPAPAGDTLGSLAIVRTTGSIRALYN